MVNVFVAPSRTVCVVGSGPAGLVLGLLLGRAGVTVTVLEKHAGFLRDFRGDTVHASPLALVDELGLGEAFAALPQRRVDRARLELDAGTLRRVQLRRWWPTALIQLEQRVAHRAS